MRLTTIILLIILFLPTVATAVTINEAHGITGFTTSSDTTWNGMRITGKYANMYIVSCTVSGGNNAPYMIIVNDSSNKVLYRSTITGGVATFNTTNLGNLTSYSITAGNDGVAYTQSYSDPGIVSYPIGGTTINWNIDVATTAGTCNINDTCADSSYADNRGRGILSCYVNNDTGPIITTTPAINITIRDAETGAIITQNITITISSNTTGNTSYTTTGGYLTANLTTGLYSIKLSNANYTQNQYTINVVNTSHIYQLNAYLQQGASSLTMQTVDDISTGIILAGAYITQQRIVNGTMVDISTRTTDITGRTIFGYLPGVAYRFIATANGYTTKTFDLDPILYTSYTIKMTRSTAINNSQDFQGISITYNPTTYYNDRTNNLTITFNSPTGIFTRYLANISYPGGTNTTNGSSSYGETLNIIFTPTGSTYADRVNITFTYDTTTSDPKTFRYQHGIILTPTNGTFISNKDQTYGMGLIDRVLIGTIIILIAAGIVGLAAGPIPGIVIAMLLMGVFIKIGLWEWWLAGISFLVAFAIIIRRTG